jgi:indole-3-glycerol phosphate synthase
LKKASPSKGVIAEDFPYVEIARAYERAGAAAVSVLTEPRYFLGKAEYLREVAEAIEIPVLRKDFVVESYQIYEAKLLGASAVLLICSILTSDALSGHIALSDALGMSALVEARDETEIRMALDAGARVIGVNNRDLKTFDVDIAHSAKLKSLVPKEILFVSESGVRTADDVSEIRTLGADAVLIGEALMRAEDKTEFLKTLAAGAEGRES